MARDANDVLREGGPSAIDEMLAKAQPYQHVLNKVHAFLSRFVAYPSNHAQVAHTLWIAHAHLMDAWVSTPRLAFLSPEPGSGKTRALEVMELLVPRPVVSMNCTPAYLFRKVGDSENGLPTVLFDEIDTVFGPKAKENEDLRGLFNAGHRRGAQVGRCVVIGKKVMTEEIDAFSALAVAGLGEIPDTILSRAVVIRMKRRAPNVKVEPYRRRKHEPQGAAVRRDLEVWAAGVLKSLMDVEPVMPPGVEDRAADVWEPLLAVADAAGGLWPDLAREAAKFFVNEAKQSSPSLGVRLLSDIRDVFGAREVMATSDMLAKLLEVEEAPWSTIQKGKPLNDEGLARRLRQYQIKSDRVHPDGPGGRRVRGFERAWFEDAWSRYLPSEPPLDQKPVQPVQPVQNAYSASKNGGSDWTGNESRTENVQPVQPCRNPSSESPAKSAFWPGGTGWTGFQGEGETDADEWPEPDHTEVT